MPVHALRSASRSRRSPIVTSSTVVASGSGRRTNARTCTVSRGASRDATSRPSSPVAPITSAFTIGSLADTVKTVRLPRRGPGIGPELSPRQELACALRILAHEGWRENLSGHITVATSDGGMWCNPWGMWWEEVRGSDVLRLDADGDVVEGKWDVTPAVFLHTELHRV